MGAGGGAGCVAEETYADDWLHHLWGIDVEEKRLVKDGERDGGATGFATVIEEKLDLKMGFTTVICEGMGAWSGRRSSESRLRTSFTTLQTPFSLEKYDTPDQI